MYVADLPVFLVTYFLAVHLERKGYIAENVVRFWMAELSCALEYLHRQRIIHRYVYCPALPLSFTHLAAGISNLTTSYWMLWDTHTSPILTLLSIIPNADCTRVSPGVWRTWLLRLSAKRAIHGTSTGGASASQLMSSSSTNVHLMVAILSE